MWETILRLFGLVWMEDERPAARWFAVGCLAIVLAGIGIVAWIYSD
jgi:hypothetical protein